METKKFLIGSIPSVLYGDSGERCYLFLHGQMGYKEEAEAFAQVVCPKGYQMLAIDLPSHGDQQNRGEELVPWTAVLDIQSAWNWAKSHWDKVALRATSIGAYFALACLDSPSQALLVSPILNMEQLREQGKIATSFGQTLSWKYLCWVQEHPVRDWKCPVCLLYGSKDNMTPTPDSGNLHSTFQCLSHCGGRRRALVPHIKTTDRAAKMGGTGKQTIATLQISMVETTNLIMEILAN